METMDDEFDCLDDFDDITADGVADGVGGGGLGASDGMDDNSEASVEERATARAKELGYRHGWLSLTTLLRQRQQELKKLGFE